MLLIGKKIGFALTASFCTFKKTIPQISRLIEEGAEVIPIMSFDSYNINSKYGKAKEFVDEIEKITGKKIINSIEDAEPIGIKTVTDAMIIAPCSGNTIGKITNGITDTPVVVAAKSHLRNEKPLIIGISTSDGLSGSSENIGKLLNRKHIYFVPFRQDNPITKPNSLVFDPKYILDTILKALDREQIQPILL